MLFYESTSHSYGSYLFVQKDMKIIFLYECAKSPLTIKWLIEKSFCIFFFFTYQKSTLKYFLKGTYIYFRITIRNIIQHTVNSTTRDKVKGITKAFLLCKPSSVGERRSRPNNSKLRSLPPQTTSICNQVVYYVYYVSTNVVCSNAKKVNEWKGLSSILKKFFPKNFDFLE